MSEGDPPSDRARVTGAINCVNSMLLTRINFLTNDLLEGALFLVKSIPTGKKSTHTTYTRDVKVAGAPGSAAGKGSPVPAQSRAHVTLYYHSRGTNQVE